MDGVWIVGDTEGVFERVAEFEGVLEDVTVVVGVDVLVLVGVFTAEAPTASSAIVNTSRPRIVCVVPESLKTETCQGKLKWTQRVEALMECTAEALAAGLAVAHCTSETVDDRRHDCCLQL